MRFCQDCGQQHNTRYEAVVCDLNVALAENRRYREALIKLDGAKVIGTHQEPGMGHAAMWGIVSQALRPADKTSTEGRDG